MDAVAGNLRDPDGTWITDRLTQAVIQFNTKEFGSAPPKTWADLGKAGMNGRLVYFSSANGDGAPRIYTLAKHLGWDVVKSDGGDQAAAGADARRSSPRFSSAASAVRASCRTTTSPGARSCRASRPTMCFRPKACRQRSAPAGCLRARRGRTPRRSTTNGGWVRKARRILVKGGKYSSRTDVAPPQGSTPLSKLKLLTLDYAEYKRDKTKILDRMASDLRRRVGQLRPGRQIVD